MKRIFLVSAYLLFFFNIQAAWAASYYEDMTGLLFSVSENYAIKGGGELSNEERKLLIAFPDGRNIFEINISSDPLSSVLEQIQLRDINTNLITNRELLGTTGVELSGSSFAENKPRSALVFNVNNYSVSILYLGDSTLEFEQFIDAIKKSGGFKDTVTHPLNSEISFVAERKIFSGYEEGNSRIFKPAQSINRAEFLKVLVLSQKENTPESVTDFFANFSNVALFPDVDRNAWFAPYIFFAYDKGWVQGYPDGSFRPGKNVNVAEAVKVLLGLHNENLDINEEIWFQPYMDFFVETNVLANDDDKYRFSFTENFFYPYEDCSRAQAAGLIARLSFLNENPDLKSFGKPVPAEGLNFVYQSKDQLEVYELGKGITAGSHHTYYLYKKNGSARVIVTSISTFYPEIWTELEKSAQLAGQNLIYLGEDKSLIYACHGCLTTNFSLKKQDLSTFEDDNIAFSFLYNQALQFENILDAQLQTVILKRDDNSQMLILSYFNGQSSPFAAEIPLSKYFFGNTEWNAYVENIKGSPRLSLVSQLNGNDMVASIPGMNQVSKLDAKIFRILRSLE